VELLTQLQLAVVALEQQEMLVLAQMEVIVLL
jgi:hypothetical protein